MLFCSIFFRGVLNVIGVKKCRVEFFSRDRGVWRGRRRGVGLFSYDSLGIGFRLWVLRMFLVVVVIGF